MNIEKTGAAQENRPVNHKKTNRLIILCSVGIIAFLYQLIAAILRQESLLRSILIVSCLLCFFLKMLFPMPIDHKKALIFLLSVYLALVSISFVYGLLQFSPPTPFQYYGFQYSASSSVSSVWAYLVYALRNIFAIFCWYPMPILLIGLLLNKSTEKAAAILSIIWRGVYIFHIGLNFDDFIRLAANVVFIIILFNHPVLSEPIIKPKQA